MVRYVLHRLFMKRHGWFIRGLEPSSTEPPPYMRTDWVPAYLQGLLEVRFGNSGIDLKELSALAATLEDLAHQEVVGRLEAVYKSSELAIAKSSDADEVKQLVSSYAMLWIQVRGQRFLDLTPEGLKQRKKEYHQKYQNMPQAERWWTGLAQGHIDRAGPGVKFDFNSTSRILDEFGQQFSEYNEHECQDLKGILVSMEDPARLGQGRINLEDYWAKKRYSYWRFTETAEKLRDLGLLDESDGRQSVIVSNYVASRNNCLASSTLYEVCCRNECEDLMSQIENKIAAPDADPVQMAALVESLSSSSVTAPRTLSAALRNQLQDAAASNDGMVHLHGRPFAMFMHYAYPRECPYPHVKGSVANPETPDEWIGDEEDNEEAPVESWSESGEVSASARRTAAAAKGPSAFGRLAIVTVFVVVMLLALAPARKMVLRTIGKSIGINGLEGGASSEWTKAERVSYAMA